MPSVHAPPLGALAALRFAEAFHTKAKGPLAILCPRSLTTLDNAPLTGWAHFRQVPRPSLINQPNPLPQRPLPAKSRPSQSELADDASPTITF